MEKKNQSQFARFGVFFFCLRRPLKVRCPISEKIGGGAACVHFKSAPEWRLSRYIGIPIYLFCPSPCFLSLFPFLFFSLSSFPFLFHFFSTPFSELGWLGPQSPPGYTPDYVGFKTQSVQVYTKGGQVLHYKYTSNAETCSVTVALANLVTPVKLPLNLKKNYC